MATEIKVFRMEHSHEPTELYVTNADWQDMVKWTGLDMAELESLPSLVFMGLRVRDINADHTHLK